jgi:hypothetical protein
MKRIEDACIDLIRRISKIHAAKCDKTGNVNIAEQSSKTLSELIGEIKINFKNLDDAFLERIKEKVKMKTHPVIHESEITK